MLTRVTLQASTPMSFDIGNVDPNELLILKSISGLTPGDITTYTGDFARSSGYYQGRRAGRRYPVFTFTINEDYANDIDVSDARDILYRTFYEPHENSDGLQVLLEDDRRPDRYFRCYGEKWQGDIFSQDTSAQISTVCVDAYLKSVNVTENTDSIGWSTVPLSYDGSADTGIELLLKVNSSTDTITISNNDQTMVLLGDFEPGDEVYVNTIEGSRQVSKNSVDIMAALTAASPWLTLRAVSNLLNIYGTSPADGKVVATSYKYRSEWWGV